jgi:hypothetical protein
LWTQSDKYEAFNATFDIGESSSLLLWGWAKLAKLAAVERCLLCDGWNFPRWDALVDAVLWIRQTGADYLIS